MSSPARARVSRVEKQGSPVRKRVSRDWKARCYVCYRVFWRSDLEVKYLGWEQGWYATCPQCGHGMFPMHWLPWRE